MAAQRLARQAGGRAAATVPNAADAGASPSETLQVTKLRQVSPFGLVDRTHLCDWQEGGRQPRLTLVSAPAGYGKSSLLHALCARMAAAGRAVGWLSLDGDDNDPIRLLTYLAAAADDAVSGTGRRTLELLRSGQQPAEILAARTLLADLERVEPQVTLFLDDAHLLTAPGAEGVLRRLIEAAPANLRFVVASRRELPLELSQLRLSRELLEIDAAALALKPEEIVALAERSGFPPLGPDVLQALHRNTEGWAAGIQLFLLAVAHGEDQEALLDRFDGRDRHLSDYLGQTVLRALRPDLREFLLQTAALDRFCDEACGALLPDAACKAMIEELDRANLFVIPLDRHRKWYRYHHLFGDFLRDRLEMEQPGRLASNLRKAARWCAAHGAVGEAISYAKRGGDFEFAADLIASAYEEAGQYQGDHGSVLHWILDLPEACLDRLPQIRLGKAWSLSFNNGHEEALAEIAKVERAAAAAPPEAAASLRQTAGMIRCVSACLSGDAETARFGGEAWLKAWPDAPDFHRGSVANAMAYACVARREFEFGLAAVELSFAAQKFVHSDYGVICALAVKGMLLIGMGRLAEAERTVRDGLERALALWGEHSQAYSQMAALLTGICYETDQIDEARRFYAAGEMAMQQIASPELKYIQYGIGARLARLEDRDRAMSLIRAGIGEARALRRPHLAARLAADGVAMLLEDGRVTQAENVAWRDFPDPLPTGSGDRSWLEAQLVAARRDIAIRLALWRGDHSSALAEANRQASDLKRRTSPAEMITARLQKAAALHGSGAARPALRAAEEAVRLALETGMTRRIVDELGWAGEVLDRFAAARTAKGSTGGDPAAGDDTAAAALQAVLRQDMPATEAEPSRRAAAGAQAADAALRPKECQILSLVAQGLSNRDIAETLFLSEKTVKWHLYNAYAKLGVKNRTAAVREARAAALLD